MLSFPPFPLRGDGSDPFHHVRTPKIRRPLSACPRIPDLSDSDRNRDTQRSLDHRGFPPDRTRSGDLQSGARLLDLPRRRVQNRWRSSLQWVHVRQRGELHDSGLAKIRTHHAEPPEMAMASFGQPRHLRKLLFCAIVWRRSVVDFWTCSRGLLAKFAGVYNAAGPTPANANRSRVRPDRIFRVGGRADLHPPEGVAIPVSARCMDLG